MQSAHSDNPLLELDLYRTFVDFTYDWEAWILPDGTYLHVSPAAQRISGYSAQNFMQDPELLLRITHPDDVAVVRAHQAAVESSQEPFAADFRIIRPSGEIRWIAHVCQAVYRTTGEWVGRRCSNRDITIRKQVEQERKHLVEQLQKALAKVRTLHGMLPICSGCKRIRTDEGYWQQIEDYVGQHSDAQFSHGLCPECLHRLYPEYADEIEAAMRDGK